MLTRSAQVGYFWYLRREVVLSTPQVRGCIGYLQKNLIVMNKQPTIKQAGISQNERMVMVVVVVVMVVVVAVVVVVIQGRRPYDQYRW
jgi:hypothetical protein